MHVRARFRRFPLENVHFLLFSKVLPAYGWPAYSCGHSRKSSSVSSGLPRMSMTISYWRGVKLRCQTPKCSAVRRAHRSRSARNTLNNLRLAFRSVESGKYKVASLVTSYKFFFMIHLYLLVNKMVVKSGLGGRMYFMFPVNVSLASTQG